MKCACYVVPLLMLFISTIGLIVATGNADKLEDLKDRIPTIDFSNRIDPFAGKPSEVPKWRRDGTGGIEVELLNALDDTWQVEFRLAVADWDFRNPDAVTIKTTKVAYDKDCQPVEGKVKVCNNDYGETNWRGINEALFDSNRFFTQSAVKMNMFYLDFEPEARQYTMCHELGHSLGVPHSDEDFLNEDLGNCMDYTLNFKVSEHPDESNYDYLSTLYGTVGGRRQLRRRSLERQEVSPPEHILSRMADEVKKLEEHADHALNVPGWRLLHRSSHGQEHEMDLGEGYTARVQMLRA